jgi:hypothetical protein
VIAVFVVGLTAGGTFTALSLWLLSGLLRWIPSGLGTAVLAGFAAVLGLRDAGLVSFPMPERRRLVPRSVFRHGPVRAALLFGLELGAGARTRVTAGAPYVVAAAILLLVESPAVAALMGASFGLGRAAMPLARWASRAGDYWDEAMQARVNWLVPTSTMVIAGLLPLTILS